MSMAPPPPFAQVVDDLIKGQQFATQLQDLLRASPKAGLIMDQILHTFSRAIHAAEAAAGEWSSDVQSEVTDGGCGGAKRKSAAGGGDRRACRRKTQQSSVVTKNLKNLDDGLAWRKYGQKEIHNCKHPKAYFRCTHKFDQKCMAQRQVQRCDDDSDTFRVTYIGVHTCQDPATAAVASHVHHHQTGTSDVLHAGYHYISFAPNAVATPATTTSTTTTMTNQLTGMDAATGSGMQSLKLESGGDQEEVLSSNTPGCSALRSTAGAATAPTWPDQGDVTSALQYSGDGLHLGDQFFDDLAYLEVLGDLVPYDLDH